MNKSNLLKYLLASAQSMTSSFTTPATNINYQDNIGIQCNILSGTPSGTLQIQVSIDYVQDYLGNVTNPGTWVNLTPASQLITSGSPTDTYFDLNQLSAPWVRVNYTATGGTGTMNIYVTGKPV